ncbi:MAG: xanthine dehydrogenase family protein molybdopterin-binding subunit, partial [Alphaproteobacteria bacterium]|nr:xanthine dehydrogenase family protein molybdopterin-binding subunit [Alphaproteobacteria bacterium]
RLLTGRGRYTDDIAPAGRVMSCVLRSPHAHAEIRRVSIEAALAAPGVLGVFTAADLAAEGVNTVPTIYRPPNRDGSVMRAPPREALASIRVRHVGEPVAFVVAETLDQARDAAELIEIDWEPLPAIAEIADAVAPGAPAGWPEAPGNVCFDWETGDEAATDRAFAAAAKVVALDLVNNRLAPTPLEARGAIGEIDACGKLTLTTGSQGSHDLHGWLCDKVFRIPPERLRVVSPDVGGGFGMRLSLFPEHILVLFAARRLGRPVKWIADRSEAFLADTHGRDNLTHAEIALDGNGRFLAVRVAILANMGAYLSQFAAFVPTRAGASMHVGVYDIPAAYVRVKGVMTNTTPVDAYRGAGRPEAAYTLERLVDAAARALGLSPDEIRRRNFIPAARMPFATALGQTYDGGEFARVMAAAMARAGWSDFASRRTEAATRGRLRGIGMSTYIEVCGGGSGENAEIRFDAEGLATVLIGTQSTGQGHETAYAQIVAAEFGLAVERVRVMQGDTDLIARGNGTSGSRSLPIGGPALACAAEKTMAKARAMAAQALDALPGELTYAAGTFTVAGTNRFVTLGDLAREPGGLSAAGYWKPAAPTFPNGCHVCEVEIDPETGETAILRYTVVDDFGVVMNPPLLAGQVYGGIAQGIGQALHERVVYDRQSAQLLSGTLLDYALPRASDLPAFDFATENVPCASNPMGVKGAGEAGAIGSCPAVINALLDALAPVGVRHIDMPATPMRVWRAIRDAKGNIE